MPRSDTIKTEVINLTPYAEDVLLIIGSFQEDYNGTPKEPLHIIDYQDKKLFYITIEASEEASEFFFPGTEIMTACEPAGKNHTPTIQFYPSGYFVLKDIKNWCNESDWPDNLHPLLICLTLSRLIHPTAASTKYTARCVYDKDKEHHDQFFRVIPFQFDNPWTEAYLPLPKSHNDNIKERTWFTKDEIQELGELFNSYLQNGIPERLAPLMWFYTFAYSANFRTVRWFYLTQCLQAILNTNDKYPRQQFIKRLPKLAEQVGIGLSKKDINDVWGYRCKVDHGGRFEKDASENELRQLFCIDQIIRKLRPETFILLAQEGTVFCRGWRNDGN